jgi:SlyX protein
MENRLTEIEMTLAHQQKMIDELNDVIIEQSKEIAALQNKTRVLKESMDQSIMKKEEDETPPPHY